MAAQAHTGLKPLETPPPPLDEFRAEVRRFLQANAKPKVREAGGAWGAGSDRVGLFDEPQSGGEKRFLAEAKNWRRIMFDAGYGWLTGPAMYGGRGWPRSHEAAYFEVERTFDVPAKAPFIIGLGMVAPTILAHGSDHAKELYLRAMYRGSIIGCQLFSEPGAGSDLASVSTRAVPDGDEWVVDGQKVWTSGAHYSDIGLLLCRTRPEPRYQNLTAFIVDMRAPGVDVRPLRQMTGGAPFNEVFLSGVRIPDHHRVGDVDDGWRVAITTLMNERSNLGGTGTGGAGVLSTARFIETARHLGLTGDTTVRQNLASVYIGLAVARYARLRSEAARRAGQLPGPEMSIAKLSLTNNLQAGSALMARLLGPRLVADTGEWGTYAWAEFALGVPGNRVGGGTDEVQRNIIAERVLGLPRDGT